MLAGEGMEPSQSASQNPTSPPPPQLDEVEKYVFGQLDKLRYYTTKGIMTQDDAAALREPLLAQLQSFQTDMMSSKAASALQAAKQSTKSGRKVERRASLLSGRKSPGGQSTGSGMLDEPPSGVASDSPQTGATAGGSDKAKSTDSVSREWYKSLRKKINQCCTTVHIDCGDPAERKTYDVPNKLGPGTKYPTHSGETVHVWGGDNAWDEVDANDNLDLASLSLMCTICPKPRSMKLKPTYSVLTIYQNDGEDRFLAAVKQHNLSTVHCNRLLGLKDKFLKPPFDEPVLKLGEGETAVAGVDAEVSHD